jgi:hypothetical protein
MNRVLLILSLALVSVAAAAQSTTPVITQVFGFRCPTSGNCPDGSFLSGFF